MPGPQMQYMAVIIILINHTTQGCASAAVRGVVREEAAEPGVRRAGAGLFSRCCRRPAGTAGQATIRPGAVWDCPPTPF